MSMRAAPTWNALSLAPKTPKGKANARTTTMQRDRLNTLQSSANHQTCQASAVLFDRGAQPPRLHGATPYLFGAAVGILSADCRSGFAVDSAFRVAKPGRKCRPPRQRSRLPLQPQADAKYLSGRRSSRWDRGEGKRTTQIRSCLRMRPGARYCPIIRPRPN